MNKNAKNKKAKKPSNSIRVLSAQASGSGQGARPVASVEFRRQNRRVHTVMTAGKANGDVVVEGRELLATLDAPSAGVDAGDFFPRSVIQLSFHRNASAATYPPTLASLGLNPTGPPTTLRLAGLARYWEKYRVIEAYVEFVSSASRNAAGSIAVGVNPDPYDYIATGTDVAPVPAVTQQQWCSRQNTTETYVGDDVVMRVPVDQSEHYYVEANRTSGVDDSSQLRLTSFGTVGVMALNTLAAQPIGSLYLRYKVELMVPRMPQEAFDSPANEALQLAVKSGQASTVALDPAIGATQVVEPDGQFPSWWNNTAKKITIAGEYMYDLATIYTTAITDAMLNNTTTYSSGLGSLFTPVSGGPTTYNYSNRGLQAIVMLAHDIGHSLAGYINASTPTGSVCYQAGGPLSVSNVTAYLLAERARRGPVTIVAQTGTESADLARAWCRRWPVYADFGCRVLMLLDGLLEPVGLDTIGFQEVVEADAVAEDSQVEPNALQFLPLECFDHLVSAWSCVPAGPAKQRFARTPEGKLLRAGAKAHRRAEVFDRCDRIGGTLAHEWRAAFTEIMASTAPPRDFIGHSGNSTQTSDARERTPPQGVGQVGNWRQGVAGQVPGTLPERLTH